MDAATATLVATPSACTCGSVHDLALPNLHDQPARSPTPSTSRSTLMSSLTKSLRSIPWLIAVGPQAPRCTDTHPPASVRPSERPTNLTPADRHLTGADTDLTDADSQPRGRRLALAPIGCPAVGHN